MKFFKKYNALLLCCVLCLPFTVHAKDNALLHAPLQQHLDKTEAQIDIGLASLTFAKEFYPQLDIAEYSKKLDALAEKTRQRLGSSADSPKQRIAALNAVLKEEGYHYDRSPDSRGVQAYYFLNGILDSKKGICYTLPLLYMAVAQRLQWPVYPVAAPDHLFLRYVDPVLNEQNIEVSSGGRYIPNEKYIADFAINEAGLKSGSYMRTMSYREFLGYLLGANAFIFAKNGELDKAITYLEKAITLVPKFADNYDSLRIAWMYKSQVGTREKSESYRDKAGQYGRHAQVLGFSSKSQ